MPMFLELLAKLVNCEYDAAAEGGLVEKTGVAAAEKFTVGPAAT